MRGCIEKEKGEVIFEERGKPVLGSTLE